MTISKDVLDELLHGVENAEDLLGDQGLVKELKVRLMERMLGAELSECSSGLKSSYTAIPPQKVFAFMSALHTIPL